MDIWILCTIEAEFRWAHPHGGSIDAGPRQSGEEVSRATSKRERPPFG
jgi:hypothetical protein